ncbi:coiled-coil domain-containing protein 83 [Hemicordylus capensis]|uniref:coiled-coil domain-containing protein 83 n=1 Tax=Hemicordylus capensis TaxID=884348 RepID=UPI0023029B69|nr:coiled-coil domain-containing protein 83 [Hemicordylus capensis]XP_053161402.1 coiled-coil domain-containing protein 83 [Hemicordylus capensis]
MVKDKKKKDKKDKKEKKKKKKSTSQLEPQTYFPEALLAYQIQIKEEIIDELLFEIKQLEEKNDRYNERNQHLKEEQIGHIRALLINLKEQEKELEKVEVVTRDDVEKAMKDKWQYVKDQEKLIKDMRLQIHAFEQKLLQKQAEIDYWLEYKNKGCAEHAKQIQVLEQDIKKLKEDLEEMTEYFRIALEETKEKIDKYTLKQMELKKEWATENAVKHIDPISCREIKENEWLKEEVAAYRREVNEMEDTAHSLEKENIYLISKLFDRRLQHLKIPRKLFLTQGAGLQMSEEDMDNIGFGDDTFDEFSASQVVLSRARRRDRRMPKDTTAEREAKRKEDEDSFELIYLHGESSVQFLPPILYEDADDFKEYKQLGDLEVKLMSIVGQSMPIHQDIQEMPSKTQIEERYDTRPNHHITYRMIKSVFP